MSPRAANYVPWEQREFCPRGHVLAEVGLYYNRGVPQRCAGCTREYNHGSRNGLAPSPLPAQPLLDVLEQRPIREYDEALQRRYYRIRAKNQVTVYTADEVACLLGMHPTEIWGDEWIT